MGSPRPQLWQHIEDLAWSLCCTIKGRIFSFITHVLLCIYAETHTVCVVFITKCEIKHSEKPRQGKTRRFIRLLLLFNNPLIRLFASPLVIKAASVYYNWSTGNSLLSTFMSSDAHLLWRPGLFTPRLIWIIMDTIFLLGNNEIEPFPWISPKAFKSRVSLWWNALWNISVMALVRSLNATVYAWICVPAWRALKHLICTRVHLHGLHGFTDAPYSCVCAGACDSQTSSSALPL